METFWKRSFTFCSGVLDYLESLSNRSAFASLGDRGRELEPSTEALILFYFLVTARQGSWCE